MSRKLQCPKCQFLILWDEKNSYIKCCNCGAEFKLRTKSKTPVLMPSTGRGTVDLLTVPNESVICGLPLIKTYIPEKWKYQCGLAGDRFDLAGNPFVVSVIFSAPDNSAEVIFTDECFYKNIEPSPRAYSLQGQLETPANSMSPSFRRLRGIMSADELCDDIAIKTGVNRLSVIKSNDYIDDELTGKLRNIARNYLSMGYVDVSVDIKEKQYKGRFDNGSQASLLCRTAVISMGRITQRSTIQMMPTPSYFGMTMRPQNVIQTVKEIFWYTPFEFTLLSTAQSFDSSLKEFNKIFKSLEHHEDIEKARNNAMMLANNAQMGMAQASAASFDRQQRIVNETIAHTSNVQQQIIAENSRSHDKISDMNSEMINEQNSFIGSEGTVMASTKYDHVYQNTNDPDIYLVEEGNSFEPGIEFEELKRKQ